LNRRKKMAKQKKKIKRLEKEYQWYKKKVDEMEDERSYDRTWDGKELLLKFKKIKLYLKTQLEYLRRTVGI